MGIFDEAIREHLELKRQQGADDSELQELEDEAFGPPARPGDEAGPASIPDAEAEVPTEFMPAPAEAATPGEAPQPAAILDQPPPPAEEEHPAAEHETVLEAPPPAPGEQLGSEAPEDDQSAAIVDQPTERYDVEAEVASALSSPSAEELDEEEVAEPRLPPPEPLDTGADIEEQPPEHSPDDDDFFDEQSLSDELDQALDTVEPPGAAPATEEQSDEDAAATEPVEGEEDVLEETPEFLQDTPEHDRLWFEQKPPKDFDFDD